MANKSEPHRGIKKEQLMARTTHRIRVVEARRVKHPVFPQIEKHYFTVRAKDLPMGIRADANAREPVGTNRQVYREVRESLLGRTSTPGTFDLMNKGITILADDVRRVDDATYELHISDGQGIVDGAHTYRIVTENQDDPDLPEEQHVEVQVRTGVEDRLITDIAKGLNTGIQVRPHSLANLSGAYEWIKKEISDEPFFKVISWREGDEGDYDVRDLICVLEALNVIDFPNSSASHPIQAYEKWSVPAAKFVKDYEANRSDLSKSTYHRLRPLLKGALILYDTIRHDFREIHNKSGGRAGHLKIIEEARKGKGFSFPFANLGAEPYRLTKGALFPIFAAFRNCVAVDKTEVKWVGGFGAVLELWQEAGPELVAETFNATRDIGYLPDQIGKSRGHWANLHKTLELRMLRQQLTKKAK
jgi:hypothetical protein